MLIDEIKQMFAKYFKKEKGSIMFVTVGLVLIILIVTAASIHWSANLAINQFRFSDVEAQKMEPYNANMVINAQIRRRLAENNPTLFDSGASLVELSRNLSHDPRGGMTNVGFYFVQTNSPSSPVVPAWPTWMTTTAGATNYNRFTKSLYPRPDNPLSDLYCIPYPDPASSNKINIEYQFYYWSAAGDTFDPANAEMLPSSNSYYTNSVYLREIPSAQLQVVAVDEFDTTKIDANLTVNVHSSTTDSQLLGQVFFPYGVLQGKSQYGGSFATGTDTYATLTKITTKNGESAGSFSSASAQTALRPNLGVSWMMDAYALPEGDNANSSYNAQRYYSKAQIINFDGQTLTSGQNIPGAITVASKFDYNKYSINTVRDYGMKRVIIDIRGLPAVNNSNNLSSYYINCTTSLAKQRGIVIIGAGSTYSHGTDCIFTNGALRLDGEQATNPLVTGTSYGGIVFTAASGTAAGNVPSWNAYIVNPSRPPRVIYTSDRTNYPLADNPGSVDIGSGAGTYDLGSAGMNYDTVQLKGRASAGAIIGFGYNGGGANSAYVFFTGTNAEVWVNDRGTPKRVQSIPASGSPLDFEITYHRSINAIGVSTKGTAANANWSPESYAFVDQGEPSVPRIETTQVSWNGSLSSITVIGRSGCSAFYNASGSEGSIVSLVNIYGGIMIGKSISGNANLSIRPSVTSGEFFVFAPASNSYPLSDRFILFDP